MSDRLEPVGMVMPAMPAVQLIAMMALGPMLGDLEEHARRSLREQVGLTDAEIDGLVAQAAGIMGTR